MRALCGAIIAAGAMIGLGLVCLGLGNRYQGFHYLNTEDPPKPQWVKFTHIDTSFMLAFVLLTAALLVGLGLAFVGLAYHHKRRSDEWAHSQRLHGHHEGPRDKPADRIPV